MVFPICLTRTVGQLAYASALGVVCTFYVSIVVILIFFCNRNIVPSPWENITNATYFKVKYKANHNFIVFVSWHRGVRTNDIICIHVLGQYSNDLLRVREKKPEANGKSNLAWISRRSLLICISRSIRISYFL